MNYCFWKLPVFIDKKGGLGVIEWDALPFKPKRVYFIFEAKGMRGGHAHKKECEVFVCLKGSFKAKIHDGKRFRIFKMDTPGQALYTNHHVWHEFYSFGKNAVMLAISSIPYDGQKGYIMDFDKFLKICAKKS